MRKIKLLFKSPSPAKFNLLDNLLEAPSMARKTGTRAKQYQQRDQPESQAWGNEIGQRIRAAEKKMARCVPGHQHW
ncbi:hypothetical protein [Aquitalea sp. LB_tupeE]|uniref:hypothetical protein n=1 Tax=Aquitalea sp. LB_tupeE TaxID=2748078 RepID=UPI0015B8FB66|nr:hypothetical protein [Aquitalea sp. LB_tupeE]NWK78482.1 hypothetical protein [Aquitalea sp. LB_tupeE]